GQVDRVGQSWDNHVLTDNRCFRYGWCVGRATIEDLISNRSRAIKEVLLSVENRCIPITRVTDRDSIIRVY
ncbi:hypothetical protein LINPERPRIM_LOCUS27753, partial [Linum perenne]